MFDTAPRRNSYQNLTSEDPETKCLYTTDQDEGQNAS
jgi:hypothetical protein